MSLYEMASKALNIIMNIIFQYVSHSLLHYRKDLLEEAKLYGADSNNFDYENAPPRGRLEGTRDFTDKPTYRKWHKFEKDDPYGISN